MHDWPIPVGAQTRGFFTRAEALEAGWTPRSIRTQLQRRLWMQLSQGRYVEAREFLMLDRDGQHRLLALATGHGRNLVIRRDSAACVHGFSVARTPRVVSVRHITDFESRDLTTVSDALVTTAPKTVIDCARFLGRREGLVVADSALRRGATSSASLADQLHLLGSAKGSPDAVFVVAEADGCAETAIESLSRYEFVAAGLPRPALQEWVGPYRLDFLWRRYGVIGEADGLGKYGQGDAEIRARLTAERRRQRALEEAGYTFVRWLWDEIWRTPDVVVARVLRELQRRGYAAS